MSRLHLLLLAGWEMVRPMGQVGRGGGGQRVLGSPGVLESKEHPPMLFARLHKSVRFITHEDCKGIWPCPDFWSVMASWDIFYAEIKILSTRILEIIIGYIFFFSFEIGSFWKQGSTSRSPSSAFIRLAIIDRVEDSVRLGGLPSLVLEPVLARSPNSFPLSRRFVFAPGTVFKVQGRAPANE